MAVMSQGNQGGGPPYPGGQLPPGYGPPQQQQQQGPWPGAPNPYGAPPQFAPPPGHYGYPPQPPPGLTAFQIVVMVWGILAACGTFVALFPCLGALNWLNIPFSVVGLVLSIVAHTTTPFPPRGGSVAGIVCCAIAVVFGTLRLILGAGVV